MPTDHVPRSAEKFVGFRRECLPYSGPLPQREHRRVAVRHEILANVISEELEKTKSISG